jgi:hypothetical protein
MALINPLALNNNNLWRRQVDLNYEISTDLKKVILSLVLRRREVPFKAWESAQLRAVAKLSPRSVIFPEDFNKTHGHDFGARAKGRAAIGEITTRLPFF